MKKSFLRILPLTIFSFAFQLHIAYADTVSVAPTADEVTVTNNLVGTQDAVYITGVTTGDIVNVYNAATGGKLIGSSTVGSNKTDATIKIAQLGISEGSVYISVTSKGMTASSRTEFDYSAELVSSAPLSDNITITNNAGKADSIYVSGLVPNDVVKIYNAATGGSLLTSATVGSTTTDVTKSFTQLGALSGKIFISVTSKGMHESARVEADYAAEYQSNTPLLSNITITNNSGKSDTVYVSGLMPGDIVNIYTSPTSTTLLGTMTVASGATDATKTFTQLGTASGMLYISVTSKGMHESLRAYANYSAEGQSSPVSTGNVTISNNTGKSDTIYLSNLSAGDKVNVYRQASGGSVLGTATVGASSSEATVTVSQLGTASGTVYISVTSSGMLEGSRVSATYSAEGLSGAIDASNIVVTNNVGKTDTVNVTGVTQGDVIKVYDSSTGTNLLGSATVAASATSGTVNISQLGTSASTIYVTITSTNKLESNKIAVAYSAEGQSSNVDTNNITISNNSGKADTIYVSGLNAGNVVNVYDSASGGSLLGSATVASSSTDATVSITQLGIGSGNIYISITDTNKHESSRTQMAYGAESNSSALDISNIVVTNNAGQADTVQVSGLSDGEIINVYDAAKGGTLLGTATVAQYSSTVNITISQLGTATGTLYLSRTSPNKTASDRVQVTYSAEAQSNLLDASNISIVNNSGSSDVIKITGLSANDIVKVYDLAKGGNLLGTATVASGSTTLSISVAQLGTSAGSAYLAVTSSNKSESNRTKVDYLAEPTSSTPKAENIVVTNNAGIVDTIQVTGLSSNDVVNVYDSATSGTLLGTATVASYGTEVTVSIDQLGTDAGSVYVAITSKNKVESSRTQVGFIAEVKSVSPVNSNVVIVNNAGIAGTVTVNELTGGDIINVYSAAQGGTLLGTATVGTYDTTATVSVSQLGSTGGNVYLSTTSTGKLESDRTTVAYSAKLVSSAPNTENITVLNNAGIQDTVKLTGLQPNDVVNVYDAAINGNLLGTSTVASNSMKATITITQLGVTDGTIYVTVKSTGKTESTRTTVAYTAELKSTAPDTTDITVVNNSGIADTVNVTGLAANDIVNVYSAATGGNLLGTATVSSGNFDATVSISQLGTKTGSIYVSVIRYGDTESDRTAATYVAESSSIPAANISIVNNAILEDTVTVNSLTANDIIKIYDAASGGNLLGSAVVSANSTSTIVSIPQLTSAAGSVYITVTNFGKSESNRTKADYTAEQKSTALFAGNISIVNNTADADDIITVSNLTPGSYIKVYDAATSGNLIGTATVSSNGTQATINISQLSTGAGRVYMSITTPGKNESSRIEADYVAEN